MYACVQLLMSASVRLLFFSGSAMGSVIAQTVNLSQKCVDRSVITNLVQKIKKIEHRIGCAIGSFSHRCKLLQNQNINLKTRLVFLNNLLRSKLSYGFYTYLACAWQFQNNIKLMPLLQEVGCNWSHYPASERSPKGEVPQGT